MINPTGFVKIGQYPQTAYLDANSIAYISQVSTTCADIGLKTGSVFSLELNSDNTLDNVAKAVLEARTTGKNIDICA